MNPDTSARLLLLALPQMGPARLAWLLAAAEAPAVVDALRAGRLPPDVGRPPPGVTRTTIGGWHERLRSTTDHVDEVLAANRALGARILSPLDPGWPLADDPEPPGLLFVLGDLDLLSVRARVAVVGTRRCTALGRTIAHRLGRDLALADAVVISGLALGVDGAAHRGALDHDGGVVGVVGGGLDIVYPRANRSLWDEVGQRGLLLSEVPTGMRPDRWRFPARNRLIAALSDGVVVVESHQRGGALSTADEALRRDRPVMVMPGSVLSPASRGTNALLVDGAVPVRDAVDVLTYLGHPVPTIVRQPADADPGAAQARLHLVGPPDEDQAPSGTDRRSGTETDPIDAIGVRILAEVATGPVHLDQLVLVTGLSVADVLAAVQELQAAGLVGLDGSTVVHREPGS